MSGCAFGLDSLTLGSFDQITAVPAIEILYEWLEEGRSGWVDGQGNPKEIPPVQGDVVDAIQNATHQINEALVHFHLRVRPLRGIVGKQGFHPFILVGPSDEVSLVIAADD